jgi:AcrR family transcriptional regulator
MLVRTGGPLAGGSPRERRSQVSDVDLEQRLQMAAARPDAIAAFRLARRWFKESRRIEMRDLAAELGVSRATLFRWIGSRDELLGEVLWSLTKPTLRAVLEGTPGSGGDRVAEVMGRFATVLTESEYFRAFLRREPERALRVITTKSGTVQRRVVAAVEELIRQELPDDHPFRLPLHDLAFIIVRITESFLYSDLIIGEPPDASKVRQTVAILF